MIDSSFGDLQFHNFDNLFPGFEAAGQGTGRGPGVGPARVAG
jgi:hypothetical protein